MTRSTWSRKGFLGLTVSCARCHDHKFDPIPQKDYYSLHGIFASTAEPKENPIIAAQGDAKQYQDYLKARRGGDGGRAASLCRTRSQRTRAALPRSTPARFAHGLAASRARIGASTSKSSGLPAKEVQEIVQFMQLEGRGVGGARRSPVFGPFFAFAELPADKFCREGRASRRGDREGNASASFPVNPHIAALFTGKAPASHRGSRRRSTPTFSRSSTRSAAAPAAPAPRRCWPAPSAPPPKDADLQELKRRALYREPAEGLRPPKTSASCSRRRPAIATSSS